jgi:hypothetical protein
VLFLICRMGRSREGPKLFLDKYEGILQTRGPHGQVQVRGVETDGYAAYERVAGRR